MSYIKGDAVNIILYYKKQNKTFLIKNNCVECVTFNVASYGDTAVRTVSKFSWLVVESTVCSFDVTYPRVINLNVDKILNIVLICYVCDKLPLCNVICKMNANVCWPITPRQIILYVYYYKIIFFFNEGKLFSERFMWTFRGKK
jgi:hypothetical protein